MARKTPEGRREYNKKYYQSHKKKDNQRSKKYYELNREKVLKKVKDYRNNNLKKIKEYKLTNKDALGKLAKIYHKKYQEENKDKLRENSKRYRELNKDKIREKKRIYARERRQTDKLYKFSENVKHRIGQSIKNSGFRKNLRTEEILGCSIIDFRAYFESKFEPWMNWNNYGKYNPNGKRTWNIDHIIPISTALNETDTIKLNHFSNLQPLCSKENGEKGAKFF